MLDPVVCSFSNRATCNPADGHYYWMYKSLFDYQNQRGSSAGITFAPAGQVDRHLQGILKAGSLRNEFRVSPMAVAGYPRHRINPAIERLLRNGLTHIQFYDGGLMELLIATRLARRHSSLEVVFNFHWAEDWVRLLSSPNTIARRLARAIRALVGELPANLALSAETKTLGEFVAQKLAVPIDIYPIASTISPKNPRDWSVRNTDVLFLPQRVSEMATVVKLAALLTSFGLTTRVVAKNESVAQFGKDLPKSSLLVGPLKENQYIDTLSDARIVVLPYDKQYFQWGSSGKFNDAIICGAFPFAPEWTAIPSQSTGPPEYHQLDLDNLEDAAIRMVERLKLGFPNGVLGVSLRDFFNWLPPAPPQPQPLRRSIDPRAGALYIWVLFLASIYRSPGRASRARKSLGKLFDAFSKLVIR